MQISQVRYFLAVCEEQSFTHAARRCGVSQPSLTIAIRRLEQTVGGPLFHRYPRGVKLTELGRVLNPYFKRLNRCISQAKCKADGFLAIKSAKSSRSKPRDRSMR